MWAKAGHRPALPDIPEDLHEVKAKYDPDNVFYHNKNIRPG